MNYNIIENLSDEDLAQLYELEAENETIFEGHLYCQGRAYVRSCSAFRRIWPNCYAYCVDYLGGSLQHCTPSCDCASESGRNNVHYCPD